MDTVVRVSNVSKIYPLYERPQDRIREALSFKRLKLHKDFYALDDVSIQVGRGECVGLIGMNGSGKSTLLQVIAGVVVPTSGTVGVGGRISALLELGAGFNQEYSGIENVKFQCTLMGIPSSEIAAVIEKVCDFADIGDFVYQPIKTYSSGMYVRLAFATAINVDPEILIVDEALAVGDIYFQTKCLNKIREFRDSGKTLLFVSHDAAAVKSLCDRAYLLHKGAIVDEGAPDTVFDHYNNLIAVKTEDIRRQSAVALRKRYGTGRIKIQSITLHNQQGVVTDTIVSGESVKLDVKFEVFQDTKSPTIGISIRDRLGIEVFGINNHNMGIDFGTVKAGEKWVATYEIDMRLGTNTYTVAVSAHPEDTHLIECFDWINEACVFRVVPSPRHKFVGSCRLDTNVSTHKLDELAT